ncbi:UDP-N-acetylmuramate dehydrogenase [Candidatus Halobeggiatoa sp. HSG11]|nr:UDP-N-acetylmuramate dehydrogenase [Candidatus Halobeggiatoa sp. HSG11]
MELVSPNIVKHIPKINGVFANPFNPVGLRGTLRHNEPLSKHTSWRVGGPAQWFYEPADMEDLIQFIQQLPANIPIFWLGLGSNLLIRDGGIRGVVILTSGLLNEIKLLDNNSIYAEAGVSCARLARFAAKANLTGIEFLAGIPGTLGGALAMNAGAWGGDTWSAVRGVETIDQHGQRHRRQVTDYEIGYRSVKGLNNEWFVNATLQLSHNPNTDGLEKIKTLLKQRSENQPIGLPSCGSVFRNPPGDYAARLIEQAGWKGYCEGGACVSEKHANFIISNETATADDIEKLIVDIQNSVKKIFQINLMPEVRIVGKNVLTLVDDEV